MDTSRRHRPFPRQRFQRALVPLPPPVLDMRVIQPLAPQDLALLALRRGIVLIHDPALELRREVPALRPIGPRPVPGPSGPLQVVLTHGHSQVYPSRPTRVTLGTSSPFVSLEPDTEGTPARGRPPCLIRGWGGRIVSCGGRPR